MHWQGPGVVKPGESFRLALVASARQLISDFPLQIKYDKSVFEVLAVAPGRFMEQGNGQTEVALRLAQNHGLVYLQQTRIGASAGGDVAVLTLRALKPSAGSRIMALSADLVGGDEQSLGHTDAVSLQIAVTP